MCSVKQCKDFDNNDGQNTGEAEEMEEVEKKRRNTRTKSAVGSGLTGLTEIRGRGLSGWLTGVLCSWGKLSGTRVERRRDG